MTSVSHYPFLDYMSHPSLQNSPQLPSSAPIPTSATTDTSPGPSAAAPDFKSSHPDSAAGTTTTATLTTSSTSTTTTATSNTSSANINDSSRDEFRCQWQECVKGFSDPETLYQHLCNDHIGRKSTGNLCLTCHWKDCGVSCAKRDHITSHLRVHTPLKPHACEVCKKSFKRPQDLKKHEKIHTEEHHMAHKHSKATVVNDPAYSARVRGASNAGEKEKRHGRMGSITNDYQPPATGSLYPAQWDTNPGPRTTMAGTKRPLALDPVEELFADVKKRRLAPSYDDRMAERLSSLAALSNLNNAIGDLHNNQGLSLATLAALQNNALLSASSTLSNSPASPPAIPISVSHENTSIRSNSGSNGFIPTSLTLNIRTPEELQALNSFLLTLGRNVTANTPSPPQPPPPMPRAPPPQASPASLGGDNWFDPAVLAQLGLAGLPGLPPAPVIEQSHHSYSGSDSNAVRDIEALYRSIQMGALDSGLHNGSSHHSRSYDHGRSSSLIYSSHTPPPASASPVSSSGSSHAGTSGLNPASFDSRLSPGVSSLYAEHTSKYRKYSGSGHSASSGLLSPVGVQGLAAPALGSREGSGLLGSGVKHNPLLGASHRNVAKPITLPKETNDQLDSKSEPEAFKTPTMGGLKVEERDEDAMSVDTSSPRARSITMGSPESRIEELPEDSTEASTPQAERDEPIYETETDAHRPSDSLYPLLHQKGDPALKLPALTFSGVGHQRRKSGDDLYADLTAALPPRTYDQEQSYGYGGVSRTRTGANTSPTPSDASTPTPSSTGVTTTPHRSPGITLPSFASIVADSESSPSSKTVQEEERVAEPPRVDDEERKRHALLIRNLLIYVNLEWLKRCALVKSQERQQQQQQQSTVQYPKLPA